MPNPGDVVQMSELEEWDAGINKGKRFVVTAIGLDDEGSPQATEVFYENGKYYVYVWRHRNPEVEYIGTGTVQVIVKFND